jgi:3-ketoacyl-CoA synthase
VFQEKILARSGLGQQTYLPPAVACSPPCPSMRTAREEFEQVMFTTVQDVLDKTGGPAASHPSSSCSCSFPTLTLARPLQA